MPVLFLTGKFLTAPHIGPCPPSDFSNPPCPAISCGGVPLSVHFHRQRMGANRRWTRPDLQIYRTFFLPLPKNYKLISSYTIGIFIKLFYIMDIIPVIQCGRKREDPEMSGSKDRQW